MNEWIKNAFDEIHAEEGRLICLSLGASFLSYATSSIGLALSISRSTATSERYNVTAITMDEGLPHNFVDDILKDSQGFL